MKTKLIAGLVLAATPALADGHVTAIDVLLEPGPKMMEEAERWNAQMRELVPEGFQLDEAHRPHVTLLQRHVSTEDLSAVLAAVDEIRQTFDVQNLELTATGLYDIPAGDVGLAGITIEPTDELLALQQAVIDAVNPLDVGAGDESAYVPDPSGTPFDPILFTYVQTFVPEQTGDRYNPHVTIGLGPRTWLDEAEAAPFDAFTFGVDAIATYQLGNFGTAARRLEPNCGRR